MIHNILVAIADFILSVLVRVITGVSTQTEANMSNAPTKTVYFANHNSHGDFLALWISLPQRWRLSVRPVAGGDYWLKSSARRFLAHHVFHALLIDRKSSNPVAITDAMSDALAKHSSLIIFPEGTRNTTDDVTLLPFKTGIYHLAKANPDVAFVPVWINNMNRIMPKGQLLPVPLLCRVNFGEAIHLQQDESKDDFLTRAYDSLLDLAPQGHEHTS